MATEEVNDQNDVVAIELPAPAGWIKKFTPKKSGTPQRNEIVFISPSGEEIKNKRQLDQYLKAHPGGPAASEFDWSKGDTPRRSARLSEKTKAVGAPSSPSPKKKPRRSSTKGAQEKGKADEEGITADEKDENAEETIEPVENSTKDAKDAMDVEANSKEEKTETKVVSEEPPITALNDTNTENTNPIIEQSNDAEADAKIEDTKEMTSEVPSAKIDEPTEDFTEIPGAKSDDPKDTSRAKKETTDGKVDTSATVGVDQNHPEEIQAAEKPDEKKNVLQEASTGS